MKTTRTLGAVGIFAVALTILFGAASASAGQFRAPSYPASLSGETYGIPSIELKTETGTSKCTQVTPSGTLSEASSSLSVTPSYSGCKAFGVGGSTFLSNSCHYVLHSLNEKHPYTGSVDIACSKEGDAIEIVPNGLNCRVRIPAQNALVGAEFQPSGLNVLISINLTGLKYTETGAACISAGEHTASTFLSKFWVQGVSFASLEAPKFEAEGYPAPVAGVGLVTMSANFGITNCSLSPEGTLSGAATSLNVGPDIHGCAYFGLKFGINDNDCSFALHPVTNEFPYSSGTLGIDCEKAGSAMTFTIPGTKCEIRIPAQSGVNSVKFESIGAGTTRSVGVTLGASGLQYTESAGCAHPGSHSDLNFSGEFNLEGYTSFEGHRSGIRQGFWLE